MRKWYKAIDDQRAMRSGERARQQGTSNTQFNYLMNGPQIENPYQTEEDAEFEDELTTVLVGIAVRRGEPWEALVPAEADDTPRRRLAAG